MYRVEPLVAATSGEGGIFLAGLFLVTDWSDWYSNGNFSIRVSDMGGGTACGSKRGFSGSVSVSSVLRWYPGK